MNEKKSGSMIGDALILFAITLIAGLVLGTVYQVTKEPIAVQKEKAKQEACMEVFQDAVSFEETEVLAARRCPADGRSRASTAWTSERLWRQKMRAAQRWVM